VLCSFSSSFRGSCYVYNLSINRRVYMDSKYSEQENELAAGG